MVSWNQWPAKCSISRFKVEVGMVTRDYPSVYAIMYTGHSISCTVVEWKGTSEKGTDFSYL